MLLKEEIKEKLNRWYSQWNSHDLEGVMSLIHDEIIFDNWFGKTIKGKKSLKRSWQGWFENHGGFHFKEIETFIDEHEQKALFRWQLTWPSIEAEYENDIEIRDGVDVLHFQDGKIIKKITFSKNIIKIRQGRRE